MTGKILLTTLNATYQHCAFGLRYLHANLGELRERAAIREFTLAHNPRDVAEKLLAEAPALVGFGVYIWNVRQTREVVSILKRVAPEVIVVVGGPEVSHETETEPLCRLADYTVRGEGELAFAGLCRDILVRRRPPPERVLSGGLPDVGALASPYPLYTDEDIRHRVLYVEASRGCPYRCEFCLSALDTAVRPFPLERFLADMDDLIRRGARQFKFVDRTFNLDARTGRRILGFFLERVSLGLFLHFEMIPDRLPEALRELIRQFPPSALQFEIGIQTWNPEVARRVSRRQNYDRVRENFAFLVSETGVHLHADLIAGLPGETLESFAAGFDAVAALRPHEIQVGILKRLKGTPIVRHDGEWEMVYGEEAPYPILKTKTMSFTELQAVARFAKFWDLYANSGNFPRTMALLAEGRPSLFREFSAFSAFLSERHPQGHGISLIRQVESAWLYLTGERGLDEASVREALVADYNGPVKRDVPPFLRMRPVSPPPSRPEKRSHIPPRQARHRDARRTSGPDSFRSPPGSCAP